MVTFKNEILNLDRQRIPYLSREMWLAHRAQDITSTEVSALFDCNKYMTKYELFQRKSSGTFISIEENERMKWGNRLQHAIGKGAASDLNVNVTELTDYIRIPSLRIGSSFDFVIDKDSIMEVKNVDSLTYKSDWIEHSDTNIEAPLHIEFQVQHQMLVGGYSKCYIVALIGGNNLKIIHRDFNANICAAILAKCKEFWNDVNSGKEPKIDWARDSHAVIDKYGHVSAGKVIILDNDNEFGDLLNKYANVSDKIKELDQLKLEVKAKILQKIGDANKAKYGPYTVSTSEIQESSYTVNRKPYRSFRVGKKDG